MRLDKASILESLMVGASTSSTKLYLLNQSLAHLIPFNQPHRVKILAVTEEEVLTTLPFLKRNKNHLGGLHACALAALGEFTAGVLILRNLGFSRYRLIMSELKAEYHYQGRASAYARATLPRKELQDRIVRHLDEGEHADYLSVTEVVDDEQRLLCTVSAQWQIKEWSKTGKAKTKEEEPSAAQG